MIIIWGALPLLLIIMTVLSLIWIAGQTVAGLLDQAAIVFFVIFTVVCIGAWCYGAIRKQCAISATIGAVAHYLIFLTYARPGYGLLKEFFVEAYATEENGVFNMIMDTVIVLPVLLIIIAAILYMEFMWFVMSMNENREEYPFYMIGGTILYAIVLAVGYLILHCIFG